MKTKRCMLTLSLFQGMVEAGSAEAIDANKMIKLFEVTKAVMKVNNIHDTTYMAVIDVLP